MEYFQTLTSTLVAMWHGVVSAWRDATTTTATTWEETLEHAKSWFGQLTSTHLYYAYAAMLVGLFWPVVVTLVLALTAASTWLFWLVTSVVFGLLQLIYVTYQFIMISADIMGLSVLKTYSMLRTQLLYYLGKSGLEERKSRRRVWRGLVDQAGTYDNFTKIPILDSPNDLQQPNGSGTRDGGIRTGITTATTPALPRWRRRLLNLVWNKSSPPSTPKRSGKSERRKKMVRSSSCANVETATPPGCEGSLLPRNKSFHTRDKSTVTTDHVRLFLQQELGMTGDMLITTTARLQEARMQASDKPKHYNNGSIATSTEDAASALHYLLSGVVKRNHLTVDDILIENARSIAESGQYGLSHEARQVIQDYHEQVEACLQWIADAPLQMELPPPLSPRSTQYSSSSHSGGLDGPSRLDIQELGGLRDPTAEISDRITLVRKMKQNMGRTALMLSGGGAQAMYHLGTIRALIDSHLYDDIKVISGTSGGSITAAMCAIKTSDELFHHVCVNTVSTDFLGTGRMKKENIRWFPPVTEMGAYWLKTKLLVDSRDFKRCCDFYFGEYTFQEAFQRTGKHVCITVSASRASGGTAQRLLLNHISTPHVTLSSAVAASCALPGVMAPAKLLAKDSNGNQEPFEVDGVEWIDGSVQADLPFQRISTLFNVSNYIVCQTNFHVLPFLNKEHHPSRRSSYWRLFQTLEWDIRNRALKLSRLGLFPRIFGQDISKVFQQRYHGNLTLVPRFTAMQTFGLKALANPTVKDMDGYLKYGQISAWPYLDVVRDMIRLEKTLDECLARLEDRCRKLAPEMDWSHNGDDLDSIASGSFHNSNISNRMRYFESGREAERLKQRVHTLENENATLKQKLDEMKKLLAKQNGSSHVDGGHESRDNEPQSGISLKEKDVWNLVRRAKEAEMPNI